MRALTTWASWLLIASLTLGPFIFNPHGWTVSTVWSSAGEWSRWMADDAGLTGPLKGGWRKFHADRLKAMRSNAPLMKLGALALSASPRALLIAGLIAVAEVRVESGVDSPGHRAPGPS